MALTRNVLHVRLQFFANHALVLHSVCHASQDIITTTINAQLRVLHL